MEKKKKRKEISLIKSARELSFWKLPPNFLIFCLQNEFSLASTFNFLEPFF